MPRKKSMDVPEGNDPIPMPGGITLEDFRQAVSETWGKVLREYKNYLRSLDQRLASLEYDARQLRPAMEANRPADTKTRERTEGTATAVQAMHGDSFSQRRVHDGPETSTCFGVKAEPSALSCKDGVVVENGATAPKSCLSPLEMRTISATGGLLLTGTISTAMKTTFDHPTLWLCLTEETNSRTSVLYASYFSNFWWINNKQAPFWSRVIEIKPGQNRMFDLGSSQGRLRACPFLGTWRALSYGEVLSFLELLVTICSVLGGIDDSGFKNV